VEKGRKTKVEMRRRKKGGGWRNDQKAIVMKTGKLKR